LVVIPDYLRLITVYNRGAVAGMAQGRTALLICGSVVALGFLWWVFCSASPTDRWRHFAVGLLFAGALGNLYDRLFRQGKVVDFIEVDLHVWPANPWPTFNVADILLCIGVGMLLLALWTGRRVVSTPRG